jgi:hypothetical protein
MCGFVNKITPAQSDYLNAQDGKPFVMTCDNEEGGCDRYFVVEVTLSAAIKTHTYND